MQQRQNRSESDEFSFLEAVKTGNLQLIENIHLSHPQTRHQLDQALRWAKNAEVVWLLLEAGADINLLNGLSLYLAASENHLPLLERLLKAQIRTEAPSDLDLKAAKRWHSHMGSQVYALIVACERGHLFIVNCLLDQGVVDITAQNNRAFISACSNGHIDIVNRLFLASARDDAYYNGLKAAASRGHLVVVQRLQEESPAGRGSALRIAAREGHLHIVQFLLQSSPPLLQFEVDQALMVACWEERLTVIEYLISQGATYNPKWEYISPHIRKFVTSK